MDHVYPAWVLVFGVVVSFVVRALAPATATAAAAAAAAATVVHSVFVIGSANQLQHDVQSDCNVFGTNQNARTAYTIPFYESQIGIRIHRTYPFLMRIIPFVRLYQRH